MNFPTKGTRTLNKTVCAVALICDFTGQERFLVVLELSCSHAAVIGSEVGRKKSSASTYELEMI